MKVNNIKTKYDKYEVDVKALIFNVVIEYYKPVIFSCNVNISNVEIKDPINRSAGSVRQS